MIEKWLRKIFAEEIAKLPAPQVNVQTLKFDDSMFLDKISDVNRSIANAWMFAEAKCDDLHTAVIKMGAPISSEEDLLRSYEAVSFAVAKVEGDKQLMEHDYLKIPEAIEWAGHYLSRRNWSDPGIANLEKLVRWKFSFNEQHREFIGGKTRTMP